MNWETAEMGTAEVGTGEMGTAQVGTAQVGLNRYTNLNIKKFLNILLS